MICCNCRIRYIDKRNINREKTKHKYINDSTLNTEMSECLCVCIINSCSDSLELQYVFLFYYFSSKATFKDIKQLMFVLINIV